MAKQHVVLWVSEDRVEVEPLVEGVRVNSYSIIVRMEVAFPASVEFAGVMLVVELKAVEPEAAKPESWEDIQITLPPKETQPGSSSTPPSSSSPSDSQCAPTIVGD